MVSSVCFVLYQTAFTPRCVLEPAAHLYFHPHSVPLGVARRLDVSLAFCITLDLASALAIGSVLLWILTCCIFLDSRFLFSCLRVELSDVLALLTSYTRSLESIWFRPALNPFV